MWALSRPVLRHCATNSRCERRAIVRVASSDSGTVSTVISANSGEIVSIIASTATTVSTDVSSWLIVIDSDDWMLSMSLVTRLSNSPRWRRVEIGQREPVHLVLDIGRAARPWCAAR